MYTYIAYDVTLEERRLYLLKFHLEINSIYINENEDVRRLRPQIASRNIISIALFCVIILIRVIKI